MGIEQRSLVVVLQVLIGRQTLEYQPDVEDEEFDSENADQQADQNNRDEGREIDKTLFKAFPKVEMIILV